MAHLISRRSVSLALALALSTGAVTGAATAAKVQPTPPGRTIVGSGESLIVSPELGDAATEGSDRVWRRVIRRDGASFVKVHLVDVNLERGDRLRLHSGSGRLVEEIRGRGPKDRGTFWSLSAFGEVLELEFVFRGDYEVAPFSIDRVIVGQIPMPLAAPPAPPGVPESICQPADFEDVICYQDDVEKWANVQASVGVMSVGGDPDNALFCSGSNVSAQSFVLTNQHCVENQAVCDNTEFVFRYFRTGCNDGSPPTEDWQSFRCDEVVASSPFLSCDQGLDDLDFTLASVLGDPAATFGFLSVDPLPLESGEDIYIVQHPDGRPHEITHGGGEDVVVSGTVLRYFDTLDTEGGSSGSPIFREADDQLVGLHHCGGCETPSGNRGMLMSDIYPHIEEFLCTPEVSLDVVGFSELEQVLGNGDAVLDPGETWRLTPRVRNSACNLTAFNVTAELAVSPQSDGPLTVVDGALAFGDIAPGGVAEAAPVQLIIDDTAPCGGSLILDLNNLVSDNGPPGIDLEAYRLRLGDSPRTTLLLADFVDPTGWTVEDGGTGTGPARTWALENPGGRTLSLTEPFAISDSDALGLGQQMDESLISPPIDASGFSEVFLQFSHDFNWYFGGNDEQADVDVRSDPTAAWTTVANFSGASSSGTVTLDISALAVGATELQVRFHYYNAEYEWWWAVDDVFLLGSNGFVCQPFEQLPQLSLTSLECPGPASIELTNATPFGVVILGAALGPGDVTVPNGPCAGTQMEIEAPLFTRRDLADASGSVTYQFSVPAGACGGVMQALDRDTCAASNPLMISP